MRKILNIVLFAADLVLLAVIVTSYVGQTAGKTGNPGSFGQGIEGVRPSAAASGKESAPAQTVQGTAAPVIPGGEVPGAALSSSAEGAADQSYRDWLLGGQGAPAGTAAAPDGSFSWVTREVLEGRAPAGSTLLEFPGTLGSWRACIFPAEGQGGEPAYRDVLIDVSEKAQLLVIFNYDAASGQSVDGPAVDEYRTAQEGYDSVFSGSYTGAGLQADGPAQLEIRVFYSAGGSEYAAGILERKDGGRAYLAMTRQRGED